MVLELKIAARTKAQFIDTLKSIIREMESGQIHHHS
jgi:hypothetical protein